MSTLDKRVAYGSAVKRERSKKHYFKRHKKLTISNTYTNSGVWDYVTYGDYMYVAADTDGIYVFDISDPANPVQGTTVTFKLPTTGASTTMPVTDVIIIGTDLFACGRSINFTDTNETGIVAKYDISAPATPSWTSSYRPANERVQIIPPSWSNHWYQGMSTDGTYLYMACQTSGLEVIEPATMTVIGDYTIADLAASGVGDAGMFWEASRISYNAGWVYLANHGNGVLALDVSTPATPATPQWYDQAPVNDTYLRVRDVITDGNYLYACPNIGGNVDRAERGLMIMDITDPTAVDVDDWVVSSIGAADNDTWIGAGDQPIMGLHKSGDYVHLANGQRGTAVFDVSTPLSPVYLGLEGTDMDTGTNLYKTFLYTLGNKTFSYYASAKDGNTLQPYLYIDYVKNP